jgi:hypothetical protein
MNIFTSFFVLLLLLSKNVPSATDKIPLIGAYYCLNMVMIATSTCSCTAVVHIFFRGQGQVPYLIRKIFLEFLARIFCMITPPVLPPSQANVAKKPNNAQSSTKSQKSGLATTTDTSSVAQQQQQPATLITSMNQSNGNLMMHHQVNRSSMMIPNNRLSHQLNSASCTALNNPEAMQLLGGSGGGGAPSNFNNIHAQGQFQTMMNTQQPPDSLYSSSFNASQRPPLIPHPQLLSNSNMNPQSPLQPQHNGHAQNAQLNSELSLSFNLIENDIKEIRDYLRHTRKKLETTDAKTKQTNEWKQVALVLDRTLFFIYIIAIIVSVALMFPR